MVNLNRSILTMRYPNKHHIYVCLRESAYPCQNFAILERNKKNKHTEKIKEK